MIYDAGTISLHMECNNEKWLGVINEGQQAQEVTGSVELPQGGERKSKAAIIGGTFYGAAEPATGVLDEIRTIVYPIFKQLVSEASSVGSLSHIEERIRSYETLLTNLGKSRLIIYQSEFSDNSDEAIATNQVIDSFHFTIECNISFDGLNKLVMDEVKSEIGGML